MPQVTVAAVFQDRHAVHQFVTARAVSVMMTSAGTTIQKEEGSTNCVQKVSASLCFVYFQPLAASSAK